MGLLEASAYPYTTFVTHSTVFAAITAEGQKHAISIPKKSALGIENYRAH